MGQEEWWSREVEGASPLAGVSVLSLHADGRLSGRWTESTLTPPSERPAASTSSRSIFTARRPTRLHAHKARVPGNHKVTWPQQADPSPAASAASLVLEEGVFLPPESAPSVASPLPRRDALELLSAADLPRNGWAEQQGGMWTSRKGRRGESSRQETVVTKPITSPDSGVSTLNAPLPATIGNSVDPVAPIPIETLLTEVQELRSWRETALHKMDSLGSNVEKLSLQNAQFCNELAQLRLLLERQHQQQQEHQQQQQLPQDFQQQQNQSNHPEEVQRQAAATRLKLVVEPEPSSASPQRVSHRVVSSPLSAAPLDGDRNGALHPEIAWKRPLVVRRDSLPVPTGEEKLRNWHIRRRSSPSLSPTPSPRATATCSPTEEVEEGKQGMPGSPPPGDRYPQSSGVVSDTALSQMCGGSAPSGAVITRVPSPGPLASGGGPNGEPVQQSTGDDELQECAYSGGAEEPAPPHLEHLFLPEEAKQHDMGVIHPLGKEEVEEVVAEGEEMVRNVGLETRVVERMEELESKETQEVEEFVSNQEAARSEVEKVEETWSGGRGNEKEEPDLAPGGLTVNRLVDEEGDREQQQLQRDQKEKEDKLAILKQRIALAEAVAQQRANEKRDKGLNTSGSAVAPSLERKSSQQLLKRGLSVPARQHLAERRSIQKYACSPPFLPCPLSTWA